MNLARDGSGIGCESGWAIAVTVGVENYQAFVTHSFTQERHMNTDKEARMQAARDHVPGTMVYPRDPSKGVVGFGREEYIAVQKERELAEREEAQAKSRTENLTPDDVAAELASGDAVLIDLREPEERVQHGTIPGAIHAPRGMLDFYADRHHHPEFGSDHRTILHCAAGERSALAADTMCSLGYRNVAHLEGGITAWKATEHPVEGGREG